jgi:hypothetical protein
MVKNKLPVIFLPELLVYQTENPDKISIESIVELLDMSVIYNLHDKKEIILNEQKFKFIPFDFKDRTKTFETIFLFIFQCRNQAIKEAVFISIMGENIPKKDLLKLLRSYVKEKITKEHLEHISNKLLSSINHKMLVCNEYIHNLTTAIQALPENEKILFKNIDKIDTLSFYHSENFYVLRNKTSLNNNLLEKQYEYINKINFRIRKTIVNFQAQTNYYGHHNLFKDFFNYIDKSIQKDMFYDFFFLNSHLLTVNSSQQLYLLFKEKGILNNTINISKKNNQLIYLPIDYLFDRLKIDFENKTNHSEEMVELLKLWFLSFNSNHEKSFANNFLSKLNDKISWLETELNIPLTKQIKDSSLSLITTEIALLYKNRKEQAKKTLFIIQNIQFYQHCFQKETLNINLPKSLLSEYDYLYNQIKDKVVLTEPEQQHINLFKMKLF